MKRTVSRKRGAERPGRPWRRHAFAVCVIVSLLQLASRGVLADNALDHTVTLDIPVNTELEEALIDWGTKAGVTVMINTQTVSRKLTHGVHGTLSARNALALILRESGLSYIQQGERIQIVPADSLVHLTSREPQSAVFSLTPSDVAPGTSVDDANVPAAASDNQNVAQRNDVDVVVVTAQKREERLQDVPVPVTAISAETLTENNQLRLQDYFSSVPGLSLTTGGAGDASLSIRGITTGGNTNSTVAITVDDVPVGTTSAVTDYDGFVIDMDPSVLSHVEVLRGPQGTLYGASSMGGLLKYVTLDPSTSDLSGRVEASGAAVYHGSSAEYSVRAAGNLPISDTIAVRVSFFDRGDPGWVDNPIDGQRGINRSRTYGGYLSGLWAPSTQFSIKFSALVQDRFSDGNSSVFQDPGFGDLEQAMALGIGKSSTRLQLYSATVKAALGPIELTAVSGYSIQNVVDQLDFTPYYNPSFGNSGFNFQIDGKTNKFSQEIRLYYEGTRFKWLLGTFYTHEYSPTNAGLYTVDQITGVTTGLFGNSSYPNELDEIAEFANVTVQFTDNFDVQVGGRESRNHQRYDETDSGGIATDLFGVPSPLVLPTEYSSDSAFTYLLTPRYKLTPDLMAYIRIASGYRTGGPNADANLFHGPEQFHPDKTLNYEFGIKGDIGQQMVSYDASLYYMGLR